MTSPRAPRPGAATSPRAGAALHTLQNTLASLKLRLGVLAADPTCRWAQEDNVVALLRLMDRAMDESARLRAHLEGKPAGQKRRSRG